jgi:ketosteroid isomerase-like protein
MIRFWPLVLTFLYSAVSTATAAPASPAEQAALKDIVVAYEQAIRSGDVSKSGIRLRLAKGFTAALPSGQIVASYADLSKAENALRTMVGRGTRYQTTEVTVDPAIEVGGDLAAFTGRTFNQATAQAGKSLAFTTHWSAVAKNEEGSWRLLRHQAVMDPATNPWQVPESTGPGWSWVLAAGLLGGLAGAVIGFAAARVLAARNSKPTHSTSPDATTAAGARTRAWDKTDANESGSVVPPSTPAANRSWQTPLPSATPTRPADPDADPPAPDPDPGTDAPPPAPRTGKKRAWEQ